jgi:hypothetical protein
MNKKAKNIEEAWEIQDRKENEAHGWIQWKGTDVCMDFHCECGFHGHIDADFVYFIKCSKCNRVYMCNGHIELIELSGEPDSCLHIAEE